VWVDDPADGLGASDPDEGKDYKQISVYIHWSENGTVRTVSASTFIKDKTTQNEPPTVNFILGDSGVLDSSKTPPDGTIFGLDDSPYKAWFDNGTIPLKASAVDEDNDIVSMRFYVGGLTPTGGLFSFSPAGNYEDNPTCLWNPNTIDNGDLLWVDGTHEVMVEVWDSHGLRDAKSIHWVIDRNPPSWLDSQPANLSAQAVDNKRIALSWQPAWDGLDKVSDYRIYRKGPDQSNFSVAASKINAPAYSYTDTDLNDWSTYQYYLTALSPGGRESTMTSNIASATTMFGISATAFKDKCKDKVTISWSAPPAAVAVDHYDLFRNGTKANASPIPGSATSFTDDKGGSGLPSKTTYSYSVTAYDSSNKVINKSVVISVTTP